MTRISESGFWVNYLGRDKTGLLWGYIGQLHCVVKEFRKVCKKFFRSNVKYLWWWLIERLYPEVKVKWIYIRCLRSTSMDWVRIEEGSCIVVWEGKLVTEWTQRFPSGLDTRNAWMRNRWQKECLNRIRSVKGIETDIVRDGLLESNSRVIRGH